MQCHSFHISTFGLGLPSCIYIPIPLDIIDRRTLVEVIEKGFLFFILHTLLFFFFFMYNMHYDLMLTLMYSRYANPSLSVRL